VRGGVHEHHEEGHRRDGWAHGLKFSDSVSPGHAGVARGLGRGCCWDLHVLWKGFWRGWAGAVRARCEPGGSAV
jgi:hypothetical protein